MGGDKHPEWLPFDWKVEERKRRGRKRKWYVAPKNGLKFFSKPHVLCYLNEDVNTQQQQREVEHDKVITDRTVAEEKILIENKRDEEFTVEKTVETEPSRADSENPIQQNELQEISVEDYSVEPCIDVPPVQPKEIQVGKSGETPAVCSAPELPPDLFFNIPWFPPAYKLITDEIPVETYVRQTSMNLSVSLQG